MSKRVLSLLRILLWTPSLLSKQSYGEVFTMAECVSGPTSAMDRSSSTTLSKTGGASALAACTKATKSCMLDQIALKSFLFSFVSCRLIADLKRRVFYQKCHDPDCKVLNYKSPG
jgi:hypothetical protein